MVRNAQHFKLKMLRKTAGVKNTTATRFIVSRTQTNRGKDFSLPRFLQRNAPAGGLSPGKLQRQKALEHFQFETPYR